MLVILLLVRVAADGDDADGRAGRVGDDDGLSGDGMLVLLVAGGGSGGGGGGVRVGGGAASLLDVARPPPTAAAAAALRGLAVGGGAVL